MKRCSHCLMEKSETDFSRNRNNRDGLQYWCKGCRSGHYVLNRTRINAKNRAWAIEHPEAIRETSKRWRERHPDQRLEVLRASAERHREENNARSRTYAVNNREKRQAQKKVQNAIASGQLKRATQCSICCDSNSTIHAHHDDYSRPLSVRWLCSRCHNRHHADIRIEKSLSFQAQA